MNCSRSNKDRIAAVDSSEDANCEISDDVGMEDAGCTETSEPNEQADEDNSVRKMDLTGLRLSVTTKVTMGRIQLVATVTKTTSRSSSLPWCAGVQDQHL